jgi:flagellin
MISVQTNLNSLLAQENLRVNNEFQSQTIQRLTSGYRINQSGDDAAGLAVANGYRSSVAELTQGVRNANDGVSTLQIVDGGLSNITKMLDRAKTLATESASGTFTGDRTTLDNEYQDLLGEINRQADAGTLGLKGDLTSAGNATTEIAAIDTALGSVGTIQGTVGSGQNKLNYATQLAQSQISSFSAAESRIRDADMAAEAANLTKSQVLQQASIAAMAQANSAPQAILALLK